MSMCCGEIVFPVITIQEMIIHGTRVYLGLIWERIVKITKTDSRIIALTKNFGSPIGIPIMPTTHIEISVKKTTGTFNSFFIKY